MKRTVFLRPVILAALVLLAHPGRSANIATQRVDITVEAISVLKIDDTAVQINNPGFGESPLTSHYEVITNVTTSRKISAILASAMPAGISLKVRLANYGLAVSKGYVLLSPTVSQDLVTKITAGSNGPRDIDYTVVANGTTPPGTYTRTVIYTLTLM